jgi:hypothetical protein
MSQFQPSEWSQPLEKAVGKRAREAREILGVLVQVGVEVGMVPVTVGVKVGVTVWVDVGEPIVGVSVAKGSQVKVKVGVAKGFGVFVKVKVGVGVAVGVSVAAGEKVKLGVAVKAGGGVGEGLADWAHKAGATAQTRSSTQNVNFDFFAPKLDRLFITVEA